MLARLPVARHSADIDILARAGSPAAALVALREDAARDLGDFFNFRLDEPHTIIQGVQGIRIPTQARLGPRLSNASASTWSPGPPSRTSRRSLHP